MPVPNIRSLTGLPATTRNRAGFTLVELVIVVVMIGILAAIIMPRVSALIQRSSARQGIGVVATDLEQAVSLAMRQRVPMRISCDCPNGVLLVSNRNTGAVLRRRYLVGSAGGFYLSGLTLSPAQVDVYPSGVASAPLTVTLTSTVGTRQVSMTSAGFVRVLP